MATSQQHSDERPEHHHHHHHQQHHHIEPKFSKMDHFISGSFAGIAQSLIGHPFDTIKVRMQTQTGDRLFKGSYDCFQQTVQREGAKALFKGMSSPLVASIVFNSILFGTFEEFKSALSVDGHLSHANFVFSCSATGCLESLLYCPLELVKARLQVQYEVAPSATAAPSPSPSPSPSASALASASASAHQRSAHPSGHAAARSASTLASALPRASPTSALMLHLSAPLATLSRHAASHAPASGSAATHAPPAHGPLSMLKEIVRLRGWRGLFVGLNGTILRECPGNVVYFGSYEACKTFYPASRPETEKIIMAGGITGMLYWTFIYPVDSLKSKLQCDDLLNPRYKGLWHCFQLSLKESGWRSLFAGLSPCLLRAFPANGAAFIAFEFSKSFLRSQAEVADVS